MSNSTRVILFDMDGTIVDTEIIAAHVVRDCFNDWGIQISSKDAEHVTGRTWELALGYLFRHYPPPLPHFEATQVIQQRYQKNIKEHAPPVPGVLEALRHFRTEFTLGLVSGSRKEDILLILDQLKIRDYFKVILGCEDYPKSKPEPDSYLKALELLSCAPENALVFEDSEAGIHAAHQAGIQVVAVTGTNHFKQNHELANWTIPDFQGLTCQWVRSRS